MNYEKSNNAVGIIDITDSAVKNIEDSILIVDDSKFSRKLLYDILHKEGFNVIAEAENGLEAIELTIEKKPKFIFLDIEMPVLDGLGALPKILEAYSSTSIIMCTAMGQQNIIEEAIRAGARDYVLKPYKKENIINIMNAMTANRDRQVIPFDRGRKNQDKIAETPIKNIVVHDLSPKDNFDECRKDLLEFTTSSDDEIKLLIETIEKEKLNENLEDKKEENNDYLIQKEIIIKVEEIIEKDEPEDGLEAQLEQFIDFHETDKKLDTDVVWEETIKEEIRKVPEKVEEAICEEINQVEVIQDEIEEKEIEEKEVIQEESRKTYEIQEDIIDEDLVNDEMIFEESIQGDSQISLGAKEEIKTDEIIMAQTYKEEEQKKGEILKLPETQEKVKEIEEVKEDEVQEETPIIHETTEKIAEPNNERLNSGINRFDYLWENRFEYRRREEIVPGYTHHRLFFHSIINSSNSCNNQLVLNYPNKEIMLGLISAYLCISNRLNPENYSFDKSQNTDQDGVRVYTESILPGRCKVKTAITMTDLLNLAAKKKQQDANNLANAIVHLVQGKTNRILG